MSVSQVAGKVLRFPGGEHVAAQPTQGALVEQAKEWHRIAQAHHFNARIAFARGDLDAAVKELVHERGKIQQVLALAKEMRSLPIGKRALELEALQQVLGAVSDELAFLPGATASQTADTLEAQAERVDNVQARLQTLADGFRSTADETAE